MFLLTCIYFLAGSKFSVINLTQRCIDDHTSFFRYFWFHHTMADFVDKVTREEIDQNVASFAVMAFTLAQHGWVAPPSQDSL